jgi:curved DNA-binding protein CbpA/translation elongation factor P/translation initiation factor 5A
MNERKLYKGAETGLNFEDGQVFEKVEINKKVISVPREEFLHIFVKDRKLTKEGKLWVKSFYEEILKTIDEDSDIEQIEKHLKSALSTLKEISPSEFYSLVSKSISFRIERLKSIKYYEEIKASNSPFLELIDFLKSYYQELNPSFVENFSLPVILKAKNEIYKIAEAIKNSNEYIIEDHQKFNLLVSFLEKSFVEKIKNLFGEKAGDKVKLKDIVEIVIRELGDKKSELISEFQSYFEKIPQLTSESISEVSVRKETPEDRRKSVFAKIRKGLRKIFLATGLVASILASTLSSLIGGRSEVVGKAYPSIKIISDRDFAYRTFKLEDYDMETLLREIEAPITEEIRITKEQLLRHTKERFLKLEPGETFYIEDLYRYIQTLTKEVFSGKPNKDSIEQFVTTVRFLLSIRVLYPQATKFKLVESGGYLKLDPVDYQEKIEVKEIAEGDVIIVGNELESVVGAIAAAKNGKKVIFVYSGPLGGLSSDKGGNMRYFDFVPEASVTPEIREVLKVLEMNQPGKQWVIPNGVEEKLLTLIQEKYPNIQLLNTRTFNSILVNKKNRKIESILTEEGQEIKGAYYLDTTPDGILAIKAGIPFTVETLNLAYGVVFDLKYLTENDLRRLENIKIDRVLEISNLTLDEVTRNEELKTLYEELRKTPKGANKYEFYTRWGYQFLAKAFKFYLKAKALKNPQDVLLQKTAEEMIVDGFNVAIRDSENGYEATFNSLSFNSDKSYHQGDHNILKENDLLFQMARRAVEEFGEFIKELTGNQYVKPIIPEELYVRQQTVAFKNLPLEEFLSSKGEGGKFSYGWDTRGIRERNPGDDTSKIYNTTLKLLRKMSPSGSLKLKWNVASSHTQLLENLFGVGKNFCDPEVAPTYRIIHNLMLVMVDLVNNLDNEQYWKKDWERKILAKEQPSIVLKITSSSSQETKVGFEEENIVFEIPFDLILRFG